MYVGWLRVTMVITTLLLRLEEERKETHQSRIVQLRLYLEISRGLDHVTIPRYLGSPAKRRRVIKKMRKRSGIELLRD